MTNLTQLSPDEITTHGQQLQARYDAFKARGLKLDLTRGKPSPAQLDLSASAAYRFPARRTTWPRTRRIAVTTAGSRVWRKRADYFPD